MKSTFTRFKVVALTLCSLAICGWLADAAQGASKKKNSISSTSSKSDSKKSKSKKSDSKKSNSKKDSSGGGSIATGGGTLAIQSGNTVDLSAGSLSGTGSVSYASASSGTYTGALTVSGGTLRLGLNNVAIGSSDTSGSGTLAFNRTSSSANLRFDLTGSSTTFDDTAVSSGTINVTGSLATAGTVNVNAPTLVYNGAAVAPLAGGSDSSGTYTILTSANLNTYNADLFFLGTNDLNLGTGRVTFALTPGTVSNGALTVTGGTLTSGSFNTTAGGILRIGTPASGNNNIPSLTIPSQSLSTQYFATQNDKPAGYQKTLGHYVPLAALATSNGVATGQDGLVTGLTVSGGGYIDTPIVSITGDGTGATAVAVIDYNTGNLTGIRITNPGSGYTSAPTFTITGGGMGNTGAISGTAGLTSNFGNPLLMPSSNNIVGPLRPALVASSNVSVVPEPNTMLLAALGLGSLFAGRAFRRRRKLQNLDR